MMVVKEKKLTAQKRRSQSTDLVLSIFHCLYVRRILVAFSFLLIAPSLSVIKQRCAISRR